MRIAHLAIAAALLAFGCQSGGQTDVAPSPTSVFDLYPIGVGHAWSYDIVQPGKDTVLLTSRVTAAEATFFRLDTVKEEIEYALRAEGIFKPQMGYFLLKDPLQQGAKWPSALGGEVHIEEMGLEVTVPAGTFPQCVRVVEEVYQRQKIEWTYAPGVGPIEGRVFDLRPTPPVLVIHARLRAFSLENPQGADGVEVQPQ